MRELSGYYEYKVCSIVFKTYKVAAKYKYNYYEIMDESVYMPHTDSRKIGDHFSEKITGKIEKVL